jgi:hypothetical protein
MNWIGPSLPKKTVEAALVPPLWFTYIGERRTTFAKADWTKMRCYGELFGVGTWELFAFTHPLSPPCPQTKKRKACMDSRVSTVPTGK